MHAVYLLQLADLGTVITAAAAPVSKRHIATLLQSYYLALFSIYDSGATILLLLATFSFRCFAITRIGTAKSDTGGISEQELAASCRDHD